MSNGRGGRHECCFGTRKKHPQGSGPPTKHNLNLPLLFAPDTSHLLVVQPPQVTVLRTARYLLCDRRFSCMWAQRIFTLVSPDCLFIYLLIQNTYLCLSNQYFLLKKSQGLFVWSHFSDCNTNSSCTLKCRKRCRVDCDASWFGRELRFNPPHAAQHRIGRP